MEKKVNNHCCNDKLLNQIGITQEILDMELAPRCGLIIEMNSLRGTELYDQSWEL